MNKKLINKFKGCLIGGAVGDALGYPVEFLNYQEILERYGDNGIMKFDLHNGIAEISDDTQMTLFTANGLLFGMTRLSMRGIGAKPEDYIAGCYHDWYKTQTENYPLQEDYHSSWLVNIPELFKRQAPGNSCLSAISKGCNGTIDKPINNSKGCGGLMRVAPIGLYFSNGNFSYNDEEIALMGAKVASLTHGHVLGYVPAAMLVAIIHKIIKYPKAILKDIIKSTVCNISILFAKHGCDKKQIEYLAALINKATKLIDNNNSDYENIKQLGQGWVAEETLAIAIYCALKYHNDFEKAIIASVNHDGDSDSIGSVTGNILGAYLGINKIPKKFINKLELKDEILEIAQDLFEDCKMSEYGYFVDEKWEAKYIYSTYKGHYDTTNYKVRYDKWDVEYHWEEDPMTKEEREVFKNLSEKEQEIFLNQIIIPRIKDRNND